MPQVIAPGPVGGSDWATSLGLSHRHFFITSVLRYRRTGNNMRLGLISSDRPIFRACNKLG